MTIKITVKKVGCSIKPKITGITDVLDNDSAINCKHTPPFIDRLSLVLYLEPTIVESDLKALHYGLSKLLDQQDIFRRFPKARVGGYQLGRKIPIEGLADERKFPLLHYRHYQNTAERLRIEFVPADLGMNGLMELHCVLKMFLPEGWGTFIRHGKITRIDIAVDFPKIDAAEFLYLPKKLGKSQFYWSNGKLTGYQHGSSKGNSISIYDRTEKRKVKGTSGQGKTGLRVERRLRNPPVHDAEQLSQLPNPFLTLTPCEMLTDPPPGEAKPYIWDLFLSAVELDGLEAALGKLPEDKRKRFRQHYLDHRCAWWDVEAIWNMWPNYLAVSKICDYQFWFIH